MKHQGQKNICHRNSKIPHSGNSCRLYDHMDWFVACMEDILDVYELPYNPEVPVIYMDEKPYQLLGEVRGSWAMRPGDNKKVDSEYVRNRTCSIFAFVEALAGKHHVSVRTSNGN